MLEIKLILNTKTYDFDNFSDLTNESYVVESIKKTNDGLVKSFYIPTEAEARNIITKSKSVSKDNPTYSRLVSTISAEATYKASLPNIQPAFTVQRSEDVDNQAVLDNYLETKEQQIEMMSLGFGKSEQTENIYPTDDSIINLIPKNCFRNNGTYSNGGAEWGFFIQTYNYSSNIKMSSVLIYDVFNIKTDFINPETISIKPVLNYNFKYDPETDVVYKDGPNNYCLANPSLSSAIQYVSLKENSLDLGVDKYKTETDNGFCFGSTTAKYIGVKKIFGSGPEDLQNIALLLGDIALGFATSGMSTGASLAIGVAYNLLGSAAINITKELYPSLYSNDTNTKIIRSTTNISGYGSFEDAKRYGNLSKYFSTRMQDADGKYSGSNRDNPLFFKDSSDSINYQMQLYSSYLSDYYTGILGHRLSLEVFNDNTNLFNWIPQYIGTIKDEWAHYIGEDLKMNTEEITDGSKDKSILFGKYHSAKIIFKPKITGTYDVLLHDMPANTTLSWSNESDNSSQKTYVDAWGNGRPISSSNYLKLYLNLYAGSTYEFEVRRRQNGYGAFGSAKMNVYLSNRNPLNPTGSWRYGLNYSWRSISYEGHAINTQFIPTTNGQYTFVLNPQNGASKDTYIKVLDSNFKKIIEDDDGFGNRMSGVKLNLVANRQYFVIGRFFNPSTTGSFEIDVFKQNYIPEMQGKVAQRTIWIPQLGSERNIYFLTSQTTSKTIRMQLTLDSNYNNYSDKPSVSISIKDSKLGFLATQSNLLENDLVFSFEANTLYLIQLSLNGTYSGGANLYVRPN